MNLTEAQLIAIIGRETYLAPSMSLRVARAIIAADLDPRSRLSFYEYLDRSTAAKEPA